MKAESVSYSRKVSFDQFCNEEFRVTYEVEEGDDISTVMDKALNAVVDALDRSKGQRELVRELEDKKVAACSRRGNTKHIRRQRVRRRGTRARNGELRKTMKKTVHEVLEQGRMTTCPRASTPAHGMNGAFVVWKGKTRVILLVSNGEGWDHVSVQVHERGNRRRLPSCEEMCWVKEVCFEPDEVAMQFHPSKFRYVNTHPYVLHLWRPQQERIPTPPIEFV